MKITMALILFITTSRTFADEVLICKGGAGGPNPAQATLTIAQDQNDQYVADLHLVNPSLPSGIDVKLAGTCTSGGDFFAEGKVGQNDGSISLSRPHEGQRVLSIYAGGDRKIEFGFGSHLLCE